MQRNTVGYVPYTLNQMIFEKGARIRALEDKELTVWFNAKNVKVNRKSLDEIIQFYSYERSIEILSKMSKNVITIHL